MRPPSPAVVRVRCGGSAVRAQNSMAEVKLVNVKKIYPFVSGEEKKSKKKKKGEEPAEEKKVNLQITDKGVVFIDLNEAEDGTLTEIPGTEKLYPADSVIVSISQGPCTTITDSTKNLKTTPRGLFETDEVGRTSIPGTLLDSVLRLLSPLM